MSDTDLTRRRLLCAGASLGGLGTAGCLRLTSDSTDATRDEEEPTTNSTRDEGAPSASDDTQTVETTEESTQQQVVELSLSQQWKPALGGDVAKSTAESFFLIESDEDGCRVDRVDTNGKSLFTVTAGGLNYMEQEQLAIGDSQLYFGGYDEAEGESSVSTGRLYCCSTTDPGETPKWEMTVDGEVIFVDAAPNLCVVGTNSYDVHYEGENQGRVYGVDPTDGTVMWQNETFDAAFIEGVERVDEGVVVGTSNRVILLDPDTGDEMAELSESGVFGGGMTLSDGVLYTSDRSDRAISVESGETLWETTELPETVDRTDCLVARDHDQVVFGTRTGRVVSLDSETGALRWKQTMPAKVTTPPKRWRGFAVVVDDSKAVRAFDLNNEGAAVESASTKPTPFCFVGDTAFFGGLDNTGYTVGVE
ncbi:PQQ-binding-like beta-propeller repeat protein [Halorubellus sp. JP-L1]|uniref:PQQ-binding-like beta-propeller repeat protein n=1 Tax=Halorubellus sp. JP-L1 TaxID=2715753 RepID=UPI00140B7842|nr:PQQ-binding-like beta-propeller repeat protein [Halorubellus sp. JP-L1]NHN41025.1 PQQ-binding-like beta-propeller repeat protein [Halorubellus sp. JP-L1]